MQELRPVVARPLVAPGMKAERKSSHVPVVIGLDVLTAAAAGAAAAAAALGASPQQAARAVIVALQALPQASCQENCYSMDSADEPEDAVKYDDNAEAFEMDFDTAAGDSNSNDQKSIVQVSRDNEKGEDDTAGDDSNIGELDRLIAQFSKNDGANDTAGDDSNSDDQEPLFQVEHAESACTEAQSSLDDGSSADGDYNCDDQQSFIKVVESVTCSQGASACMQSLQRCMIRALETGDRELAKHCIDMMEKLSLAWPQG